MTNVTLFSYIKIQNKIVKSYTLVRTFRCERSSPQVVTAAHNTSLSTVYLLMSNNIPRNLQLILMIELTLRSKLPGLHSVYDLACVKMATKLHTICDHLMFQLTYLVIQRSLQGNMEWTFVCVRPNHLRFSLSKSSSWLAVKFKK